MFGGTDQSQAEERGTRRYTRALASSGAGLVSQAVQIGTALLTVPLALNYLGSERYGLWMTLSSVAIVITFADLGVGIGLQNELARCLGAGDRTGAQAALSVGSAFYLSIFALIMLVCMPLVARVPWGKWIAVESAVARAEMVPAFRVVILGLAVGLLAGLAQRVLDAHQQGYQSQLAMTGGRVISVACLLLAIQWKGGMATLVATVVVVPYLFVLGTGIRFAIREHWLIPSLRAVRLSTLKGLLATGGIGLLAVAAYAVLCNGAPFVIATRWGAGQVTSYAVTMRIVTLATGMLFVLLSPLWPAYGEAFARGDTDWVRTAFRRSLSAAAPLFGAGFIVLALFGRPLIRFWTGSDAAVPSASLLWACAVFGLLSIWNVAASTLLNGLGHFLGQGTYGLACAIGFLWLSSQSPGGWGIEGVIWIIDAGYTLRCALMALEVNGLYARRLHP